MDNPGRRALVGHTGFVGTTLRRQTTFDDCFRSTNIEEIAGRQYDLLVCAGAPAEKWKANLNPAQDLANIERLMSCLDRVEAAHVVLISTVDVYASPIGVHEDSDVRTDDATAYGRHRFQLETFVRARFPTTCLRLPGLFGLGLKKNIIFDLLHDNSLAAINPESRFQFYPLDRLWNDIGIARANALPLVNLAVEPVSVRDVAEQGFGRSLDNPAAPSPARYDMHTRHAALFGGHGDYLLDTAQELSAIRAFVADWRATHS
jgi:nucleoside-diphosphate-sugar epimerase